MPAFVIDLLCPYLVMTLCRLHAGPYPSRPPALQDPLINHFVINTSAKVPKLWELLSAHCLKLAMPALIAYLLHVPPASSLEFSPLAYICFLHLLGLPILPTSPPSAYSLANLPLLMLIHLPFLPASA